MKTLKSLLDENWIPVQKLPKDYSFRCFIRFKEFGRGGESDNHMSTGIWWHMDNVFSIDCEDMKKFTPEYFIPLYDEIDEL